MFCVAFSRLEMYSNFVPETNISEMMETVNEVRKMCHYFHEKIAEGKSNDANGKLQLEKIRQEYRDQLEMFSGVVDEFVSKIMIRNITTSSHNVLRTI